jgi:hypothetical protein
MNEQTAEHDLDNFGKNKLTSHSAHKIDGDRASRPLVPTISGYSHGRPVLCDFSEARFREYDNVADIQLYQHWSPEVNFDILSDESWIFEMLERWYASVYQATLAWERKICSVPLEVQRISRIAFIIWRT